MNERQFEEVCRIAIDKDISFDDALDHYLLYGTGEAAQRAEDRARWNAAVDSKKMSRRDAN